MRSRFEVYIRRVKNRDLIVLIGYYPFNNLTLLLN